MADEKDQARNVAAKVLETPDDHTSDAVVLARELVRAHDEIEKLTMVALLRKK